MNDRAAERARPRAQSRRFATDRDRCTRRRISSAEPPIGERTPLARGLQRDREVSAYLARTLGREYTDYQAAVRRWV